MNQESPLTLVPASFFLYRRLAQLLDRAYADYFIPVRLSTVDFARMCVFEDVNLGQSVVATVGRQPVGLALLSRRDERGWISGVGVVPAYRRHGVARRMVSHLQERARLLGLCLLLLEVLHQNQRGLMLYEQLGFERRRELLVLTLEGNVVHPAPLPPSITRVEPATALAHYAAFHDVEPSWQREPVGLWRHASFLQALLLQTGGRPEGYVLYDEQQRYFSIYDLAVLSGHPRRLELARTLLLALHAHRPSLGGYVINLPQTSPLLPVFLGMGYRVWQRQYEMAWQVPAD
ncbi:MAG: GNAT family N-acetyltransferase [Anaerolineales bacterium]